MAKKKVRKKRPSDERLRKRRKRRRRRPEKLTEFQKFQRNKPAFYSTIAIATFIVLFLVNQLGIVDSVREIASVPNHVKKPKPEINGHTLERIDGHMKNAAIQKQLKMQKIEMENRNQAPAATFNLEESFEDPVHSYGVETRADDSLDKINNDIGDETETLDLKLNPEERVAAKIQKERFMNEYNKAHDQAYVEAFIANAAKDGWEVEVNDKMEIINVRKKKRRRLDIQ